MSSLSHCLRLLRLPALWLPVLLALWLPLAAGARALAHAHEGHGAIATVETATAATAAHAAVSDTAAAPARHDHAGHAGHGDASCPCATGCAVAPSPAPFAADHATEVRRAAVPHVMRGRVTAPELRPPSA
jgi:hypothetical protein